MSKHTHSGHTHHPEEKFSVVLFVVTLALTLAGLFAGLRFLAPSVWHAQFAASGWAFAGTFVGVHILAAACEYAFHRYVLHAPLVPFLAYFYKQHTLHHALTRIGYKKTSSGKAEMPVLEDRPVVENRYPITEEKQQEASFFPWYTLAVFSLAASVVFAPIQYFFPQLPVFLAGFLAIAWSLALYEIIHAIEHLPVEKWAVLLEHPKYGKFWSKLYSFHLRHHADIRCNEGISGVFGFPLIDFIAGTYVDTQTLFPHGRPADPKAFESPRPRFGIVRWLDRRAEEAVKKRRARRMSGETV